MQPALKAVKKLTSTVFFSQDMVYVILGYKPDLTGMDECYNNIRNEDGERSRSKSSLRSRVRNADASEGGDSRQSKRMRASSSE